MCVLTNEKRGEIKAATEAYKVEVAKINHLLEQEPDAKRRVNLLLLRAVATIEHGNAVGLFSEDMEDDYLEAITEEHLKHCGDLDNSALFEDIAILTEDTKEKIFADPAGERLRLSSELGL